MINPKNRIELIEQIREDTKLQKFWSEKKEEFSVKKHELDSLFNKTVAKNKLPEFYDLWDKQFKVSNEKWEYFLRLALFHYDKMEFMYNKTNSLLVKHKISKKDYFKIKLHNSECSLPDQIYELIMFENICKKFFGILKLIERKYSFDSQSREQVSKKIHGKIDWMKTLKVSKYSTPQYFQISFNVKEFELPENILLAFTIYKIFEIVKSYQTRHENNELSQKEVEIVRSIDQKIKKCMRNFPHNKILDQGKKLAKQNINSFTIREILKECKNKKNNFENKGYKLFLDWFDDFTDIHNKINQKRLQTNYKNEATKDFDTMFEIWVLMELYDTADNRYGILENIKLKNPLKKEFEFLINGHKCVMQYDQQSDLGESNSVWATTSKPDYLIKYNGTPIAVFDAKNTFASRGEPNHKILGYMMNFECDLGGAIYSNTKSNDKSERVNESKEKKFCNYELDLKNHENHDRVLEKIFSDIEEKLVLKDSNYGR
jgi:hypothetical protein